MKILYFNYNTTAFASILRSLEYAKAASDEGHDVTLCYLHRYFRPPAAFFDLMDSYASPNFRVSYPAREPQDGKTTQAAPKKAGIGRVVDGRPTLKGLYRQIFASVRYVPEEMRLVDRFRPDVLMVRPDNVFSYMATARMRNLPLVLECDGPVEELDLYWGLDSRWVRPLDTWRARRAAALTYISRPCGEMWRKKNIPARKMFYTPNAAHPQRWKPLDPESRRALRREYGLEGFKVFGFSGNLRSWHGVDLLIASILPLMERDPSIKLLFIGAVDDPEFLARQKVPDRIRERRFAFTGPVAYPRMGEHIDLADCMVIPYPHSDFFYFSPMKLFEAMCLGKLIVAPRLGQIEEMLGDLDSPLLYDPKDPAGLSGGLDKAVERIASRPEGGMLGADARTRIESAHTWAHRGRTVVQACEFAVQSAVAPRSGGRP